MANLKRGAMAAAKKRKGTSFKCNRPGCKHVSKTQAQATSHAWTHRRAEATVATPPKKRAYKRHATPITVAEPTLKRAAVKVMTRPSAFVPTTEDLEMLLLGYQTKAADVDARIAEIRQRLGGMAPREIPHGAGAGAWSGKGGVTPTKKHRISPEGLKRIRDAQKRRWAAAKHAPAATEAAPAAQAT